MCSHLLPDNFYHIHDYIRNFAPYRQPQVLEAAIYLSAAKRKSDILVMAYRKS